jgi:hypothetical protein
LIEITDYADGKHSKGQRGLSDLEGITLAQVRFVLLGATGKSSNINWATFPSMPLLGNAAIDLAVADPAFRLPPKNVTESCRDA